MSTGFKKLLNYKWMWLIPYSCFIVLVLAGSLAHPLWEDEANIALFARSINQFGVPKGFDGVNLIGGHLGTALNSSFINTFNSWVELYLPALSFRLFGESAFTARLPFMLIGFSTIPLLYVLAKKITDPKIAFLSVLILSLQIPYVLYAYDARYYMIITASLLGMLLFGFNLEEKGWRIKLAFVLAGLLGIYTLYSTFPFFYAASFFGIWAYKWLAGGNFKPTARWVGLYLGLGILVFALFLPYYFSVFTTSGQSGYVDLTPQIVTGTFVVDATQLVKYVNLTNNFPVLFVLPAIFALYLLVKTRDRQKLAPFVAIYLMAFLYMFFVVTGDSIFNHGDLALASERYLTIIFPLFALANAIVLAKILEWNKFIFGLLLIALVFTSTLALQPKVLLLDYLGEVVNPYPSPDQIVAQYLEQNARDGDTAFVSLDRDHEPLIWYLGKKIKFINLLNPSDHKFFPKAYKILPKYIYADLNEPDWVILYSKRGNDGSSLTFDYRGSFPLGLSPGVDLQNDYQETVLPVFFSDESRPEIDLHSFTAVNPAYNDQVFIYHKIH